MLRRGCEGLTSEQIDFRIDVLGAEMAVDTSASTVAIHAQVIARNLDAFVDLLARLMKAPTFAQSEIDRLKRETVAEIIEARDNDRVVATKAFQRTLFEELPPLRGRNAGGIDELGRGTSSGETSSRSTSAEVVPANIVRGLSGDVTPEQAPRITKRIVEGLSRGEASRDDVREPTMTPGRRLLVVDKPERTQTQILVGCLGTSADDEDHVPFSVANAIVFCPGAGVLSLPGHVHLTPDMREVRSKRGWSYGASARASVDRHRQSWVMWTFPAAEDAAACLKLTLELMETWVNEGVTAEEITFIKGYLIGSYAFDIDTAAKRMHQALEVELLGLPAGYFRTWTEKVAAVTPEEASRAVKRRIHPENLLTVVVATASQVLEPLRASVPQLSEVSVVPFDAE